MASNTFAFYNAVLRKHFVAFCADRLERLGVTYGQLFVMILVDKLGECTPKQIGAFLRLDPGHLNRTLTKLDESGMIERRPNARDGRSKIVTLTDAGRRVVASSRELFREWDELVLSDMAPDDRDALLALMRSLVQGLRDKNGDQA